MKRSSIILIVVLVVIAIPIVWYLTSPLFLDKVVDEDIPSSGTGADPGSVSGDSENVIVISEGSFSGADSFHQVSGEAKIVSVDGQEYLRLEDFESTNGPDLKVYLSNDLNADDYVSLGELKGNIGNQNYELSGIDYDNYKYVLIWCERFSVLFGSSEIE